MHAIVDFDAEWRWKISMNRIVAQVEQEEGSKIYVRVQNNIYI